MMAAQTFGLPFRLANSSAVLLCPGFPPSPLLLPFAERVVPYIHDLFLITRPGDLNARAKLYMAKPFALAVRRYPRFLVNSLDTARKLRAFCRSDAKILTYRPRVRNVFGVNPVDRASPPETNRHFACSASAPLSRARTIPMRRASSRELRSNGFAEATLEIVGRDGWGDDRCQLEGEPGVILTGYLSSEEVRHSLQQADALLCTSHEEGLGLPLLEAQYAGLPIIAPDDAVFREVLANPASSSIASIAWPQRAPSLRCCGQAMDVPAFAG